MSQTSFAGRKTRLQNIISGFCLTNVLIFGSQRGCLGALAFSFPTSTKRSVKIPSFTTSSQSYKFSRGWTLYAKEQENVSIDFEEIAIERISDEHSPLDQVNGSDNEMNRNEKTHNSLLQSIFLGIEPTPDILAITAIYFVEGALGLARLAQTFLLKDELHLGPAELSAITGLLVLPWTVKPLYGFLSDGFPLFGYRRRSYLILAGSVGFASYALLAWGMGGAEGGSPKNMALTLTILLLILSSGSIAFSDVVADGIVVQKTREANERGDDPAIAGGLQSLCWGSAALGGLISAYFSGSLLETMSPRQVFGIASLLPLLVAGMSLLIEEIPVERKVTLDSSTTKGSVLANFIESESMASIKQQISSLWASSNAVFPHERYWFGPEFLGRVRLVTAASSLFGVWLYQKLLRRVAIKNVLLWTSIISVPLGLTQLLLISHYNRELGIPDAAFVFGDDVALSILGELAFLPTLVLAARLCPAGVEAVLFATLMSIYNGASTVGTELGAGLTKFLGVTDSDFSNLALLTIICNLSSLLPLFFIGWLDEVGDESQDDMENKYSKQ
ncbi:hypothetical protein HJC23_007443 [Cyclotella cryptica]|uniref:Biopterin transport-related protein BT1 n=1 Tax=Cyclotella cryptica TaxID=29204 RepID=A0ABD3QHS8_9STRA